MEVGEWLNVGAIENHPLTQGFSALNYMLYRRGLSHYVQVYCAQCIHRISIVYWLLPHYNPDTNTNYRLSIPTCMWLLWLPVSHLPRLVCLLQVYESGSPESPHAALAHETLDQQSVCVP